MKLKKYIQFMKESVVEIDNRLPNYYQIISYFQAIDDEYKLQVLYSYTDGGRERVNHHRGPEFGIPYYTLTNNCIMDGYVIHVFSNGLDEALQSEIKHCIENIRIDLKDILIDYTYDIAINRYSIYITYNKAMIDTYINDKFGRKSMLGEAVNVDILPSIEELKDYFQAIKDETNSFKILKMVDSDLKTIGYKIKAMFSARIHTEKDIKFEADNATTNIKIDYPNINCVVNTESNRHKQIKMTVAIGKHEKVKNKNQVLVESFENNNPPTTVDT